MFERNGFRMMFGSCRGGHLSRSWQGEVRSAWLRQAAEKIESEGRLRRRGGQRRDEYDHWASPHGPQVLYFSDRDGYLQARRNALQVQVAEVRTRRGMDAIGPGRFNRSVVQIRIFMFILSKAFPEDKSSLSRYVFIFHFQKLCGSFSFELNF